MAGMLSKSSTNGVVKSIGALGRLSTVKFSESFPGCGSVNERLCIAALIAYVPGVARF